MIKKPLIRRIVICLVLFGLFTQLQTLFACELMDGKAQTQCCCDEPGDMSMGCTKGGGCADQNDLITSAANCCDVSYQQVSSTIAITAQAHDQQILLLDASQPPPTLTEVIATDFSLSNPLVLFTFALPPPIVNADIYLHTHRIRI